MYLFLNVRSYCRPPPARDAMPKPVCRTNLYNKIVQLEVCRTFSGRGMGINGTAQLSDCRPPPARDAAEELLSLLALAGARQAKNSSLSIYLSLALSLSLSLSIYIYIYICIYTYTYIHTYIHTYICMCVCIYIYIYI